MKSNKPKILGSLGMSYLKRILKLSNGPVFVSLFFTRKCNYNCSYCNSNKNQNKVDLSLDQWKNIINQIYYEGCRFITIYGGEPTLRSDLGELIKYCIDLNIFTHVVTNGSLLNNDMLDELVSCGYFTLGISIDTLSDWQISPKKYRPELIKILQNKKHTHPHNIDYSIHIVTTNENINELVPLIIKINNNLECKFSIDPVHSSRLSDESYKYRGFCPDLLLKKEDMHKLRKTIQNLKRHGIQIWSPNIYYHYMNKWYEKRYHWDCDAGDLYYAIDSDGTIMLCEDVSTNIQFEDFINMPYKKRIRLIRKFKFKYCDWNPTNFIKHPIKNFIYQFRFS